ANGVQSKRVICAKPQFLILAQNFLVSRRRTLLHSPTERKGVRYPTLTRRPRPVVVATSNHTQRRTLAMNALRPICLALAALLTASTGAARADFLMTDWAISGANSNLYRLQTGTGTATLIGSTSQPRMIG